MTRKTIDCRNTPSESGCTLTIVGEPEEVLEAAAQHAVARHGHDDTDELRTMLRTILRDEPTTVSEPGAFVQLIEFRTERIEEWDGIQDRRHTAIGADETVRWSMLGADRDRLDTYVAIVEFPDYDRATASSRHPATDAWAADLTKICSDDLAFRNLDVRRARPY